MCPDLKEVLLFNPIFFVLSWNFYFFLNEVSFMKLETQWNSISIFLFDYLSRPKTFGHEWLIIDYWKHQVWNKTFLWNKHQKDVPYCFFFFLNSIVFGCPLHSFLISPPKKERKAFGLLMLSNLCCFFFLIWNC